LILTSGIILGCNSDPFPQSRPSIFLQNPSNLVFFQPSVGSGYQIIADGQFLVHYSTDASDQQIADFERMLRSRNILRVGQIPQTRMVQFSFPSTIDLASLISEFSSNPILDSISPNYAFVPTREQNPNLCNEQNYGEVVVYKLDVTHQ
jgi:hypothetical protein